MAQKTRVMCASVSPIAWLAVVSGPGAGRDFRLGSETNIGRDPARNDIILDDDAVSAEHARVKLEGKQFVLYDLASTNHTFVNGRRIQRHLLFEGDEIEIGNSKLVFTWVRPR